MFRKALYLPSNDEPVLVTSCKNTATKKIPVLRPRLIIGGNIEMDKLNRYEYSQLLALQTRTPVATSSRYEATQIIQIM